MSNPFDEPDEVEILEGFLCPICRADLKSSEVLLEHFERYHAEEQDALKSIFKDIFSKAKKKIRQNFDDSFDLSRNLEKNASISGGSGSQNNGIITAPSASNAHTRMNVYNFMDRQEIGTQRDHLEYFQVIRNPRIERYASETNKLIIRLHKLLKDMPQDPLLRKTHEQQTVIWLDGSLVKLCPNCAKSFHIARRQHHCRLCGSIMCNDCSRFLPISDAVELASLTIKQSEPIKIDNLEKITSLQQNGIRICSHCIWLLETRKEMNESRNCIPPMTKYYLQIQEFRKDVTPDIDMYLKMVASLYEGESIYTLGAASALRGKIGQIAESIDVLSKHIMTLPCQEGSREEALKKGIRLSCVQLIKEKMLALPPLPSEEKVRQIQEQKRMQAEQRIEMERRIAMEAYERHGLNNTTDNFERAGKDDYAYGSDLRSLDNWTAHQINTSGISQNDDPLVEQINIIKGYIKQAKKDMNFEVVETLETNLRELQGEFYQRQRASTQMNSSLVNSSTE
ncbi:rabenosyn-5 [Teleopsis dalmanni]|uniref:rabenosyn-5 n=1 Tax=Teleopsis dalmanni TaxID=139649 RepID=UPI0018CE0C2B|nr:rabenosyn-5 [Teleopsis dalmanni]